MKKYIAVIFFICVFFSFNNAQAKIRSIVDWDGGQNPHKTDTTTITGEKVDSSCSRACEGYSLTIATCPQGMKLARCPKSGCSYYNNCVKMDENEEKSSAATTDKLLEDIDIDAIYEEILKEQEAAKNPK